MNPLIPQGQLNRIRGAVVVPGNASLNVTAPYLGKEGISLAKNGEITTQIPTMTGMVTSPEPYVPVIVTIHLVRSQALAQQYETQQQTNSVLGDITITPDAVTLNDYKVFNSSILTVEPQKFDGTDAGYVVTLGGYQTLNSSLWGV